MSAGTPTSDTPAAGSAAWAAALARRLPRADIEKLVAALGNEPTGLAGLEARSGSTVIRDACRQLREVVEGDDEACVIAGTLAGALAAVETTRDSPRIDVAWTGPTSEVTTGRLTSETIVDMLDSAQREILVVGFAVHDEPRVTRALQAAAHRYVEITLVLERSDDNPGYSGPTKPFGDLDATRLAWPRDQRPAGAALHAKVLVIDRRWALVGSANITGRAMQSNLECGIVIRGGHQPAAICAHIDSLRFGRALTRVG